MAETLHDKIKSAIYTPDRALWLDPEDVEDIVTDVANALGLDLAAIEEPTLEYAAVERGHEHELNFGDWYDASYMRWLEFNVAANRERGLDYHIITRTVTESPWREHPSRKESQ